MPRDIHISVVSHSQCRLVYELLNNLAELECAVRFQVTLTHNLPPVEQIEPGNYPFPVQLLQNAVPKGFAANHNAAFKMPPNMTERRYYLVINPDVNINGQVFSTLTNHLETDSSIGVIAPSVINVEGQVEDSARTLPTIIRILKKFFGQRGEWPRDGMEAFKPDWIAGMFMLFPADVFSKIGGFDNRYFLYYEDVDLCSRLWLKGYCVVLLPSVSVVHDARRQSRSDLKYLRWHVSSMMRFFSSAVYRKAKSFHKLRRNPA